VCLCVYECLCAGARPGTVAVRRRLAPPVLRCSKQAVLTSFCVCSESPSPEPRTHENLSLSIFASFLAVRSCALVSDIYGSSHHDCFRGLSCNDPLDCFAPQQRHTHAPWKLLQQLAVSSAICSPHAERSLHCLAIGVTTIRCLWIEFCSELLSLLRIALQRGKQTIIGSYRSQANSKHATY